MTDTAIYSIVMGIYLVVLMLAGYLTGRKTRSASDFYLGGRQIGPWVTALSFIAAYFSSVVIVGGGGFGYKYGMATIWIGTINVLLGCTLCWIIFGKRIREFTTRLKTMTIPGFLHKRYNSPEAQIIAAVVILIFMIVYNVSVLQGMGRIFEVLMQIPYLWAVIISVIIIIFYVAIGGYLAVVWTSFIQAWIMFFGLILLTVVTLQKVGGLRVAAQQLSALDPGLVETPGLWGWSGLISYALIVSFGVWGMPQLIVRFYSIKNTKVLRLGTVVVTIGGCLAILPYMNGALSRLLYPALSNPDLAIPTLTKGVLSPIGGAILLAGVVAAGMSTFAAVLIIISSALVEDIFQEGLKIKLDSKKAMRYGRITSIIVGLLSLVIAFDPPSLILVLTAFAWAVIASTCLWPMLFGIYWKGTTRAGVVASMIGGCAISLIWMVLGKPYGIHGFIPGILVGLILIIVVSLITPRFSEQHIARIWGEEAKKDA
ncbi:sodium/proline symporter [bacterium]|nr:sodium/proline symporter [bacterium]